MEVIKLEVKRFAPSLLTAVLVLLIGIQADAQDISCREKDGLLGPVASVLSESHFFYKQNGKYVEGKRHLYTSTTNYAKDVEVCERPQVVQPFQGHIEYKYDGRGQAVEWSYRWPSGELDVCALDPMGKCTSMNRYTASGELESRLKYEYAYDSHGNWIRMRVSKHAAGFNGGREEGTPLYAVYRKIAYY